MDHKKVLTNAIVNLVKEKPSEAVASVHKVIVSKMNELANGRARQARPERTSARPGLRRK